MPLELPNTRLDKATIASGVSALLDEVERFPASLPLATIRLHGAEAYVFSSQSGNMAVLEAVFGPQAEVFAASAATHGAWRVGAVASDRLHDACEAIYFDGLKAQCPSMEVKRWGGDFPACRVDFDEDTAIIRHDRPFRGLTIFSSRARLSLYVRREAELLNVPHFEHLVKYALRVQHWDRKVEVHAAVCRYRERGILLVGFRKSGKTTLAMHMLRRRGTMIGSDLGLLSSCGGRWLLEAIPHMCRVAPETVNDNRFVRDAMEAFAGNRDYLRGPVFFDSKFEMYADPMNKVFGRPVNAARCTVDLIILPRFSASCARQRFCPMPVESAAVLLRDRLVHDKPLPDWLPFDQVRKRAKLEKQPLDQLLRTLPPVAELYFGTTATLDWKSFDAVIDSGFAEQAQAT